MVAATQRDDSVFAWGNVKTFSVLPIGTYDFVVTDVRMEYSRENQLRMYVVEMEVVEPVLKRGEIHNEYCVFGKRPFNWEGDDPAYAEFAALDDPNGVDPLNAQFSSGMRKFKYLFSEAGIEFSNETRISQIQDKVAREKVMVGAVVTQSTTARGSQRNELPTFYPAGTQVADITVVPKKGGKPASQVANNGRTQPKRAAGSAAQAAGRTRADVEAELDDVELD